MPDGTPGFGHNNPPSPFDEVRERIDLLYDEAKNWMDGEPVQTQAQCDELAKLLNMLREAQKQADELRKAEVKPHDEAKAAIQARYADLIADTKSKKGKAVRAIESVKAAIAAFLAEQEREKRAAAEKARLEAEAKQREAEAALRASRADDLEAREAAEAKVKEAKQAEVFAARAAKDTARASGGGRAVSLRTYYRAEITDDREFAAYVWRTHREEMAKFLQKFAQQLTDDKFRSLPGVTVHEEKRAA